jgi:hypothetical protein
MKFSFCLIAHANLRSWHDRTRQPWRGSSSITLPFDGTFAASSSNDTSQCSTEQGSMLQIPSWRSPTSHHHPKTHHQWPPQTNHREWACKSFGKNHKRASRPSRLDCLRRHISLNRLTRAKATALIRSSRRIHLLAHRATHFRLHRHLMPPAATERSSQEKAE